MIIAIYTRVSTEDQTKEGYSLEVQKEYLELLLNQKGIKINL
ncbi:MAG: recombinase family protein [Elusimicrobia bacterium]|nr:recombinase family protein [Elusimicrobiota bacterium]